MDKREITKVLAFLSMTDGSLHKHKGCVNASFHLSMSLRNDDMVDYVTPYISSLDVGYKVTTDEKYFRLSTKVHPFFTTLYDRVYPCGHKVPSVHDFKLLDWEAVAIMYMCDGNIQLSGRKWYPLLNLCRFSYPELQWIRTKFKETLGLDSSVYKCGKYYRMGIPDKHRDLFFDSVRPYMLPSFSYKLPDGKPQLGDEIVRSIGKPMETGGNTLSL